MPSLQLPLIQNWSCHNCGGCCRQHLIEITPEERQRILSQKWTAADGVPEGRKSTVRFAGLPWRKRYRLANRADGACVFLDEHGLCRIHAKFGEASKPLPCRIYPYAFHPAGRKLAVSLRFSCPSVVANRGKAVASQAGELKRMADAVMPADVAKMPPPAISRHADVEWSDFRRFSDVLEALFAESGPPLLVRLLRSVALARLIGQSRFDALQGERLGEYLSIIRTAAAQDIDSVLASEILPASRAGRLQFRMMAAQYARRDTFETAARGIRGRIELLRAALRFARGRETVPVFQAGFREVPFARLEEPFGGVNAEMDTLLTRYFRVKIAGLHFCGPAYYGVPLVEGVFSLALVFPVVMWLARWMAASDGRDRIATDDVGRALSIADHHHGYNPVFGSRGSRRRVRLLTHHDDLERLCRWYAR